MYIIRKSLITTTYNHLHLSNFSNYFNTSYLLPVMISSKIDFRIPSVVRLLTDRNVVHPINLSFKIYRCKNFLRNRPQFQKCLLVIHFLRTIRIH